MPTIECPNCSMRLEAQEKYEGRTATCKRCSKQFVIRIGDPVAASTAKPSPTVPGQAANSMFVPLPEPADRRPLRKRRLTSCDDCGETVSRRAPSCPHCGASRRKASDPFVLAALGTAVVLAGFMSPMLFPLVLAACVGLWLVGLARSFDGPSIAGLIVSALTFLIVAAAVSSQIEHERASTERIRSLSP